MLRLRLFVAAAGLAAPGLWAAPAQAAPSPGKPLAGLNELTRMLTPAGALGPEERAALVAAGDAVAARDGVYVPTAQSVLVAALLERMGADLPKPRGTRLLVELAVSLARFGGPGGEPLEAPFYRTLLGQLGVKPEDAMPRPQLGAELAEIGLWAAGAVETFAQALPPEDAARARVRTLLARGRFTDAEALARKMAVPPAGGTAPDPRWHAWLGASLRLLGKGDEAAPFEAAAQASGGEAWTIVRAARLRRARAAAFVHVEKTLRTTHAEAATACRKLATELKPGPRAAPLLLACAEVLGPEAYGDSFQQAVTRLGPRSPAVAMRAAASLRKLLGDGQPRAPEAERGKLLAQYHEDVTVSTRDEEERRILYALGWLAAAASMSDWKPSSDAEIKLVVELGARAPCDPMSFAVRAAAARSKKDRPALATFLREVIDRCTAPPGGAGAATNALTLAVMLAHETPSSMAPDTVLALAEALARARPGDPQVITVHADALALRELSQKPPRRIGLEAALARYEEAVALATPAAGDLARVHRDVNAAVLALALARLTPAGSNERRQHLALADHHARMALALGESLPALAARAAVDLELGSGQMVVSTDLAARPAGSARARVACLLARRVLAQKNGAPATLGSFVSLARAPAPPDERRFAVDALVPESSGTFQVLLEEQGLRPFLELKTNLDLFAPCDPATL